MVKPWAKSHLVLEIADRIRPLLAGNEPEVQGAVLAELTVSWLLGHRPDIRSLMLVTHYKACVAMANLYAEQSDPWRDEDAIAKAEAEAEAKKATKQ